jgi:hypothetical protein
MVCASMTYRALPIYTDLPAQGDSIREGMLGERERTHCRCEELLGDGEEALDNGMGHRTDGNFVLLQPGCITIPLH